MSRPPFLTLPPGAKSVRVETARGVFAAHEANPGGAATALLVPGFTGSKEDFVALLHPLAEAGFHVVAVDGRGQHETPGPADASAYAQQELARDVLALANATAGPGQGPVHVLGHSLGGLIVRAAAIEEPRRFASVTLMSSGPAAIAPGQRARTEMLIDALATTDRETVWRAMRALDPPEAAAARTPADIADFLHHRWLLTEPAQLIATGRQLISEQDRVPALAATGLPAHVLSGERDYAWPLPLMDAMAVRLAARRTVIEGAEHSPNVDRPRQTARALADFWLAH